MTFKKILSFCETIVFDLHQAQQGQRALSGSGSTSWQEDELQLFARATFSSIANAVSA